MVLTFAVKLVVVMLVGSNVNVPGKSWRIFTTTLANRILSPGPPPFEPTILKITAVVCDTSDVAAGLVERFPGHGKLRLLSTFKVVRLTKFEELVWPEVV